MKKKSLFGFLFKKKEKKPESNEPVLEEIKEYKERIDKKKGMSKYIYWYIEQELIMNLQPNEEIKDVLFDRYS